MYEINQSTEPCFSVPSCMCLWESVEREDVGEACITRNAKNSLTDGTSPLILPVNLYSRSCICEISCTRIGQRHNDILRFITNLFTCLSVRLLHYGLLEQVNWF